MIAVKLIHPEMGLVAINRVSVNTHYQKVIKNWKYRYGKKFYECKVEVEKPAENAKNNDVYARPIKPHMRKLVNTRTGEIYKNQKEAAKALKLDEDTIRSHAKKKLKGRFDYIVRYAD
jgi:hypothetical protein